MAVKQVAATGLMALYNRYRLYAEALRSQPDLAADGETIRHYTLTFVGYKFVFWVLRPTLDDAGRWNGCAMKRLHGPSCERAIKVVLQFGGVRTFTNA
ncbi:hypothetical protein GE09DRAFT_1232413 [Coniochaeta sp. 2T2.1]|nr:hypothetical protein GE09DRAFT_1232413 [Coniochaeta sp. 2T2.1]